MIVNKLTRVYATDVPYENKKYVGVYKHLYTGLYRSLLCTIEYYSKHSTKYTKLTRGMLLCSLSMYTILLRVSKSIYILHNIKVYKEWNTTYCYTGEL